MVIMLLCPLRLTNFMRHVTPFPVSFPSFSAAKLLTVFKNVARLGVGIPLTSVIRFVGY
jgi:hypothetical protein